MRDPLDEALGLPAIEREPLEIVVPEKVSNDADYEHARETVYRLLAKAEERLDELGEIAQVSQSARAYEVYSNLLKATVDTAKDIMALKKTMKDSTGTAPTGGQNVTNNMLIATSDEVLRMIKGEK